MLISFPFKLEKTPTELSLHQFGGKSLLRVFLLPSEHSFALRVAHLYFIPALVSQLYLKHFYSQPSNKRSLSSIAMSCVSAYHYLSQLQCRRYAL